jgi:UDP-N-acetyl-D-glucosamine dehydrogenase
MKISVIGQGYVGSTVAIGAAEAGHQVVGLDIDKKLISNLLEGKSVFPGSDFNAVKNLISKGNYLPTVDTEKIKNSEIIIIAVPTPLDSERKPDLRALESASQLIGGIIDSEALIINESTSFPGTLRNFIKPIIESISKVNFEYASSPERIDPANEKWLLKNTPRVIGGLTEVSLKKAVNFYKTFCSNIFEVSSPEVAEAAKLFENTFRQVNIALVNEFSLIATAMGISSSEALMAASSKPYGFMSFYPSIGVGGHCIPVDPTYLSFTASKLGLTAHMIELANKINLSMVENIIPRLSMTLGGSLNGKRIQIAGISYKANVSDLRESPALDLIHELRKKGAIVTWHDPLVLKYKDEVSVELDEFTELGIIVSPHDLINFEIWKEKGTKVLDFSPNFNNYGWPKFL